MGRASACMALLVALGACGRKGDSDASAATSGSTKEVIGPSAGECLTQFDFLVPFQRYGEADLVRAIVVDGDQVYFRTYTEVFRVPIAGGTPMRMTNMPGGLMDSPIWSAGDQFITQSPGEPIFLALPKAGGAWTTILDGSNDKLGGGRALPNRLLHDIAKGSRSKADAAVFDGSFFYWIQETNERGRGAATWAVRKLALAGGAPATLYESPNALSGLQKAGDLLVFFWQESQGANKAAAKSAKSHGIGITDKVVPALMSLPLAGGKPDVLVPKIDGNILVADGSTLYISGFDQGDITKQGVFRIDASGNSALTPTGLPHILRGGGSIYGGDRVALWGISALKKVPPGEIPETGRVVLTTPRGGAFERTACIGTGYTTHAHVVSNKTLLVSIFRDQDRTAGIVRIKLP
jgi:hypothetical protein